MFCFQVCHNITDSNIIILFQYSKSVHPRKVGGPTRPFLDHQSTVRHDRPARVTVHVKREILKIYKDKSGEWDSEFDNVV